MILIICNKAEPVCKWCNHSEPHEKHDYCTEEVICVRGKSVKCEKVEPMTDEKVISWD